MSTPTRLEDATARPFRRVVQPAGPRPNGRGAIEDQGNDEHDDDDTDDGDEAYLHPPERYISGRPRWMFPLLILDTVPPEKVKAWDAHEDKLEDTFGAIQRYRVAIRKMCPVSGAATARHRWNRVAVDDDPQAITESWLLRTYGPGRYDAMVYAIVDANGERKEYRTRMFGIHIAAPEAPVRAVNPVSPPVPQPAAPPAAPPPAFVPQASPFGAMPGMPGMPGMPALPAPSSFTEYMQAMQFAQYLADQADERKRKERREEEQHRILLAKLEDEAEDRQRRRRQDEEEQRRRDADWRRERDRADEERRDRDAERARKRREEERERAADLEERVARSASLDPVERAKAAQEQLEMLRDLFAKRDGDGDGHSSTFERLLSLIMNNVGPGLAQVAAFIKDDRSRQAKLDESRIALEREQTRLALAAYQQRAANVPTPAPQPPAAPPPVSPVAPTEAPPAPVPPPPAAPVEAPQKPETDQDPEDETDEPEEDGDEEDDPCEECGAVGPCEHDACQECGAVGPCEHDDEKETVIVGPDGKPVQLPPGVSLPALGSGFVGSP